MTNGEKYLKDGVDVDKFVKEFRTSGTALLDTWLNEPFKITLTEDERVILKNIDTRRYPTIKRTKIGEIIVISNAKCGDDIICYMYCYDHLFQFIKNGEEYSIKELLKGE